MTQSSILLQLPFRLRAIIVALQFSCLILPNYAAAPDWWQTRNILVPPSVPADDYAALNQGQLKNLVRGAIDELNATLPGGAGTALTTMLSAWRGSSVNSDDYAVVTVGQVKAVAKLVYTQMQAQGHVVGALPWSNGVQNYDDYAIANIGQAKAAFGFVVPNIDTDGDGYFDAREIAAMTDPLEAGSNPSGPTDVPPRDSDRDGVSDADELLAGSNLFQKDAQSVNLVVHPMTAAP